MKLAFLFALMFASCTEAPKPSIAILTPTTHPSLEQIEKGFQDTIESTHPGQYRIVTYNAQGNKTLMRGEIEKIAREDHALVFTIGALASQMTTEVFNKKALETPVVFTAVSDPSALASGKHVTGVQQILDFERELDLALQYKPNIRSILLVLNPMEPGIAKDGQEVQAILSQRGISLIPIEVFQTNELIGKVSPFIHNADAMIVLKDNTVVSGLDPLIKLCNKAKIPLIASDLDSPDRGAAFGYGVHEKEFGVEAAAMALQILQEKIAAGDIPVRPVSNFTFKVNRDAAIAQGIALQ